MKKNKNILIAVGLLLVVVVGIFISKELGRDYSSKTIGITIKVEDKIIYEDSIATDAALLSDVVKELESSGKVKVQYENGAYGMYITAMGIDAMYEENPSDSLYWTYNSPNNEECVKAGYCEGLDYLKVQDQDKFIFELTSEWD